MSEFQLLFGFKDIDVAAALHKPVLLLCILLNDVFEEQQETILLIEFLFNKKISLKHVKPLDSQMRDFCFVLQHVSVKIFSNCEQEI